MTPAEARSRVIAAISKATPSIHQERVSRALADPGGDLAFSDVDIDSLAAMEMCVEIEDQTGVEVDLGDIARYPSVNQLASFIAGKKATNDR
jgi:acyl carrier protein